MQTLARRAMRLPGPLHPDSADAISLDSGYAFPEIFPDLTRAAARALTVFRSESLQYGSPYGLRPMREWIAQYMRDDGAAVTAENVIVVNGAKHGLELICRLLVDDGDAVVVTGPTYFTAIPILRSFGLTFIEVPQDEEGLDVVMLAKRLAQRERDRLPAPKFIYDVPDFHNPSGITMSLRRRQALLALATSRSIPIVEDSPYRRLRFEGSSEPSLKSLDRSGIVFALGTFSKLIAPGLRIGWICAEADSIVRIAQLKSDGGTAPMTQRIIVEFFADGGLEPQIARARAAYGEHRDRMIEAVRRDLPSAVFTPPHGGYYLWLRFPDGIDTGVLAERAFEAGVSPIAGNAFFAADDPSSARAQGIPSHYMRLAYSNATPDRIDRGVKLLADTLRSME
ncbi:MAG TPA: PLP-dependent aminotransferase family protein [Candidatus Baltobacteraceae bacterium]|nr:PLP-dependent aminotransferase family protein [Candidatus Baltobacteraceae bacterium]